MGVRRMDDIDIPPYQGSRRWSQWRRRIRSLTAPIDMPIVIAAAQSEGNRGTDNEGSEQHGGNRTEGPSIVGKLYMAEDSQDVWKEKLFLRTRQDHVNIISSVEKAAS